MKITALALLLLAQTSTYAESTADKTERMERMCDSLNRDLAIIQGSKQRIELGTFIGLKNRFEDILTLMVEILTDIPFSGGNINRLEAIGDKIDKAGKQMEKLRDKLGKQKPARPLIARFSFYI